MNTNRKTVEMDEIKVKLSALWIFATLNYLYADVFTLFFSREARNAAGTLTQGAVLGFAVLMETAIAMVLLSRVLKVRANRWANIIAGVLHTAAVSGSLFTGTLEPFYMFFAAIEIACTVFIVWYAWTWPNPEGQP